MFLIFLLLATVCLGHYGDQPPAYLDVGVDIYAHKGPPPPCDYIDPFLGYRRATDAGPHIELEGRLEDDEDDDDDDEDDDDDDKEEYPNYSRWHMPRWIEMYKAKGNEMMAEVIIDKVITPYLDDIEFVGHDMIGRRLSSLAVDPSKVFRVTTRFSHSSNLLEYIDKYHMLATDAQRNGWSLSIPRAEQTTRVALVLHHGEYKYGWEKGGYVWISKLQLLLTHFNMVIEDIRMD